MTDPSPDTWKRLASRRLIPHAVAPNGQRRNALLYVPQHVHRRRGLPLVLMLHGGASSPETIARRSAMHMLAEKAGFIVAYPRGMPGQSKTSLTWNPAGNAEARKANDMGFLRALIHDIERRYDVDPDRIYIAGFSIGGSLVYELAGLMAERIAAMAVVSGTMTLGHSAPANPVPLIHIHGTADRRVPFEGGSGPATKRAGGWSPVQEGLERWREINGCVTPPEPIEPTPEGVKAVRYVGAADVELWLIQGGMHVWPGARFSVSESHRIPSGMFSATETIWDFFARHSKSRPRVAADGRQLLESDTSPGAQRPPVTPLTRRGSQ